PALDLVPVVVERGYVVAALERDPLDGARYAGGQDVAGRRRDDVVLRTVHQEDRAFDRAEGGGDLVVGLAQRQETRHRRGVVGQLGLVGVGDVVPDRRHRRAATVEDAAQHLPEGLGRGLDGG